MDSFLREVLNFLTIELAVLLTAALPIIELRGAIPIGISLGLSPVNAAVISFVGSMLPVPVLLFGIRPMFTLLRRKKPFSDIVQILVSRSLAKSHKIQKYGAIGLVFFVAVPLPGTGIWTGALIAALLDMRFKLAFPAILAGNAIAAIAVMGLSTGVISVIGG